MTDPNAALLKALGASKDPLAKDAIAAIKSLTALVVKQGATLKESLAHLEAATSEKQFVQNQALHDQVGRLTLQLADVTKERDALQDEVGLLHKALAPVAQAKTSVAVAVDTANGVDGTLPPVNEDIAYYVEVMRNQCIAVAMGDYKNLFTPTEFTKLTKDVLMMEQAARIGKSIVRLPLPMPVTLVPVPPPGAKV
jgi:hypothetical protein